MSLYYLDTSAAIKLLVRETEVLSAFLANQSDLRLVSSTLLRIELSRSSRRIGLDDEESVHALLAGFALISVDGQVVDGATREPDPALRSLDAIHLATARTLMPELTALVTYDRRLVAVGAASGLPVVSPGI